MRLSDDGVWILCEIENCDAKVKNHAWGQIKADTWFFSKHKDAAYCPDHIPEWLAEWRRRKRERHADLPTTP